MTLTRMEKITYDTELISARQNGPKKKTSSYEQPLRGGLTFKLENW